MNITLIGFAEEVPVTDLKSVNRFLVLKNDSGKQLRIPVGEEAIATVAQFLMQSSQEPLPEEDSPVLSKQGSDELQEEDAPPEGAEVFGGDEDEEIPQEEEEEPQPSFEFPDAPSDDSVPSDGVESL